MKVYVAPSSMPKAGRGVFAAADIKAGETIEECLVIEMAEKGIREKLEHMTLRNYYFVWGDPSTPLGAGKGDRAAIALGSGSIYNHSYEPNARYIKHFAEKRIDFVALRDIAKGEEITVNYNGDPADKKPLWKGALP